MLSRCLFQLLILFIAAGFTMESSGTWRSTNEMLLQGDYFTSSNKPRFRRGNAKSSFSSVGLATDSVWLKGTYGATLKGDALYGSDEKSFHWNVENLFIARESRSVLLTVGRKLHPWSRGEQAFKSGLWQPRFLRDKLDIKENGLTGIWWQTDNGKFKWTLLASLLTVPDLGNSLKENNGQFDVPNAWFETPPFYFDFRGKILPINYTVNRPSTSSVVHRAGVATQVVYENRGYWSSLQYGYKPINQMLLGFEAVTYRESNNYAAQLTVSTRWLYHHIATAEVGFKNRNRDSWLSITSDQPVKDEVPTNLTAANVSDAIIFSAGHKYKWSRTELSADLYKRWGGIESDTGPLANESSYFESRFNYSEAIQLSFTQNIVNTAKRRYFMPVKLLWDFAQQGYVAQAGFSVQSEKWQLQFSGDLLGVVTSEKTDFHDGFIGRYRANDRISTRFKYLF